MLIHFNGWQYMQCCGTLTNTNTFIIPDLINLWNKYISLILNTSLHPSAQLTHQCKLIQRDLKGRIQQAAAAFLSAFFNEKA